jgi:hypothetical protein
LTYTEAIEVLQKAVADGVIFEEKVEWSMELPSEMDDTFANRFTKCQSS